MKSYVVLLFAAVLLLAVGVGAVRGDDFCPPGGKTFISCPTGVPPTAKVTPFDPGPTPTSPPFPTSTVGIPTTEVPSPTPVLTWTPGLTPYPEPGTPAVDNPPAYPGPGKTPLSGGDPGAGNDPTAVATLPVTGGGLVAIGWQLTVVGIAVCLGVAFIARMGRRAIR